MLMVTPETIRILRLDQAKREAKAAARLKPKFRKLKATLFDRLVDAAARILKTGEPTRFEFEAACRHGLRRSLIRSGWRWADADNAAAEVVAKALHQIGAVRPTWNQGQPEFAENQRTERYFCARCGGKLDPISRTVHSAKYCSKLCSNAAHLAKMRWSGERVSMAEYLAACAEKAAQTVRERTRECPSCKKPFIAVRSEQVFCSSVCLGRAQRTEPDIPCETCGTIFRARMIKGVRQRFCSLPCSVAARAPRPVESLAPRPKFSCEWCGVLFQGSRISRARRFCSKPCATKHTRNRSRFQCEGIQ